MRRACATALLVALFLPSPAAAQDTVDGQFWFLALATVRLSENWRLHLEEQPRWHENASESFQVLTRTALGRRVHDRATLWGGYAWIAKPPGPGVTHEHRLWQQLSASFPTVASWDPSLRLRVEQRFQDTWEGASHRVRLMGRAVRPLDAARRWSAVAWDEFFVTVDDSPRGPWQGVDQNRLFAGLLRQLNPTTGLEFGYLWTTSKPPSAARSHAHVGFVWLNLAF